MLKRTTTLLLAGGTLLLGACGDKDDDKNEPDRSARRGASNLIEESGLIGYWASTCDKFPLLEMSGRAFYNFEPDIYEKRVALYTDGECNADAQLEIRYRGEFEIGNKDDLPEGMQRIDFVVKRVEVKPLTDEGVKVLNTAKFCGVENYAPNKTQEVTQQAAETDCVPEKPEARQFDVFKLENDKLRFGGSYLTGAPNASSERPRELKDRVFEETDKWE